jgi:hypothetical protein
MQMSNSTLGKAIGRLQSEGLGAQTSLKSHLQCLHSESNFREEVYYIAPIKDKYLRIIICIPPHLCNREMLA